MVAKVFLLIILACLIQVYEADISNDITVSYGITPQFIKIFNHKDDFGSLLTLRAMEEFLINHDSKALLCYDKHFDVYKSIVVKFAIKLKELAEYAKIYIKKEKISKRISNCLKRMSKNIGLYPEGMRNIMKDNDYETAVDYFNEVLFTMELIESQLLATLIRHKRGKPMDKVKFDQIRVKYEEIRVKTKTRSAEFLEQFLQCLKSQNDEP